MRSEHRRDYSRWGRTNSFASNVARLKEWLGLRVEWIDSQWLAPPTPDVSSAAVEPGTQMTLSTPVGEIYYTLDGSDPRGEDGVIHPQATLATSPIPLGELTQVTARVYRADHGPDQGYVLSGDDWSPSFRQTYFTNTPADAGPDSCWSSPALIWPRRACVSAPGSTFSPRFRASR